MAISPIRASRCCSKYVFSCAPVVETDRWWDAMQLAVDGVDERCWRVSRL